MRMRGSSGAFVGLHVAAAMAVIPIVACDAASPPSVAVEQGWFRSLPGALPAAGYFVLHNTGDKPLVLRGADSSACGAVMLHKSDSMNGMAMMEDVPKVDVPAGGTLRFAPGGYHLMCMNPTAKMKVGTEVPVTLHFIDATEVEAGFAVRGATGQ